ncbi:MAG: hypothetical protein KAR11_06520 [Phycisphaerae bacterium]|nr:hypothetical protein [Phycisphaerae bacterium]
MGRVAKKTKPASGNLAVEKKTGKGKLPIKIVKPKATKSEVQHNDVSTPAAAMKAALANEDINTKAVEEAKKALAAGELDSPEAIRRVAERIFDSEF